MSRFVKPFRSHSVSRLAPLATLAGLTGCSDLSRFGESSVGLEAAASSLQ